MENTGLALVKIDPKEYGIQESKAKELEAVFLPMIEKMKELEVEYNAIITKPKDKELCKEAKELRHKYVKLRTATALIHKEAKAFYLAGGKFVDSWKNAQLYASQGIEAKLEEIETYYEKLEVEEKKQLNEQRTIEYTKYSSNISGLNFAEMTDEVWNVFITGAKTNYDARIEAEKRAEQEKIEREALELKRQQELEEQQKKEQEVLRLENEKKRLEAERKKEEQHQYELKVAREEHEKAIKEKNELLLKQAQDEKERLQKEKIEAAQKEKERVEKEKRDAEEKERTRLENKKKEEELQEKIRKETIEKERIKEQLKIQKEEADKKANEEKIQREKLEAEIRIQKAEEEKRKADLEREQAKQRLAEKRLKNAPDKVKLTHFIKELKSIVQPSINIDNEEARKIELFVVNGLNKIYMEALIEIEKL